MDPRSTLAISDVRKKWLLERAIFVMVDLHVEFSAVKGPKGMAQEMLNRIESISKHPDEYNFLVDVVTYLISKSKGAELQVLDRGKPISREKLFRDYGIILAANKSKWDKI